MEYLINSIKNSSGDIDKYTRLGGINVNESFTEDAEGIINICESIDKDTLCDLVNKYNGLKDLISSRSARWITLHNIPVKSLIEVAEEKLKTAKHDYAVLYTDPNNEYFKRATVNRDYYSKALTKLENLENECHEIELKKHKDAEVLRKSSYSSHRNNGFSGSEATMDWGRGGESKSRTYHRTTTHHKHAGHNYVVYTGPRGGRYIKRGGAYISIARL